MNTAIALAQFVMLALAAMASNILVNAESVPAAGGTLGDHLTRFLAGQGLWLLIIPAVWLLFAGWCEKTKSPLARSVQGIGAGIAVAILVMIVFVLAF